MIQIRILDYKFLCERRFLIEKTSMRSESGSEFLFVVTLASYFSMKNRMMRFFFFIKREISCAITTFPASWRILSLSLGTRLQADKACRASNREPSERDREPKEAGMCVGA